jgi:2-methylcitrate dehydratase PrpD
MTVFEQLAVFAIETPSAEIPSLALDAATASFVDTVGVMFAGRDEPATRIVQGLVAADASSGPCRLVTGGSAGAGGAALVNATAAHALDYDDATTVALSGHASAVLVPTALAAGQERSRAGLEALAAYVLGYEVEIAIAQILNPAHFDRGFHPTATLGVFGATCVAARLRGATTDEAATALGIAASLSAGIKANFGTMTKPLHCGWAAHSGLFAGLLAIDGFTANRGAFEDRLGFGNAFGGPGWADRAAGPLDRLGRTWTLVEPGIDLRKLWPVCGSVLTSIEAGLELHGLVGVGGSDIDRVEIGVHARRVAQIDRPRPASGQDARYSAQYVVARALLDGSLPADAFDDRSVADPRVAALLGRTRLVADDRQTGRTDRLDGRDLGARVSVHLRDGRQLGAVVDDPLGSPRKPAGAGALASKFESAVSQAVGRDRADRLRRGLEGLRELPDLRGLPGFEVAAADAVAS